MQTHNSKETRNEKSSQRHPVSASQQKLQTEERKESVSQLALEPAPQDHQISALSIEKDRLQGQCMRLCEQLDQERRERNELEQEKRETCSRLEQERDEALRTKDGLTQRVAQLEEQLRARTAETQQLRSALRSSTREVEFWKVARQEIQVVSHIGEGAWGCVAKGVFRGQEVAVKWPHPALLDPQGHTVGRLHREVQIMAQVRHPNLLLFIAAVFDEQTERLAEPPLIVTELLAMNLRTAYQGNLLGTSRMSIFRDVAHALNYLHLHLEPIIHRDVSAPNVLLEERHNGNWKAKLSDFGSANLARLAHTMGEGAIIYAAPETIPSFIHDLDSPVVPQTTKIDVYSYGVLLCEVTTSRFPDPEQYRSMMSQVKQQSPFIHRLIELCTKRSPSDRPTMAQIISDLDRYT